MRHADRWTPSKFLQRGDRLIASRADGTRWGKKLAARTASRFPLGYFMVAGRHVAGPSARASVPYA